MNSGKNRRRLQYWSTGKQIATQPVAEPYRWVAKPRKERSMSNLGKLLLLTATLFVINRMCTFHCKAIYH